LREMLAKEDDEPTPRRMLVFDGAGASFLRPLPYFEWNKAVNQYVNELNTLVKRNVWKKRRSILNWILLAAIVLIPPLRNSVLSLFGAVYGSTFGLLPDWLELILWAVFVFCSVGYFITAKIADKIGGRDMVLRARSWWLGAILGRKNPNKPRRPSLLRTWLEMAVMVAALVVFLMIFGVLDPDTVSRFFNGLLQ